MPAFYGLDIGSSSIKLVQISGNNVNVAGVAQNPTGKVGVDLVPAEIAVLSDAVKGLIAQLKPKSKKVVVSMPESLVFTKIMSFPFMSSPELATAIKWEAEQVVPYPIDKLELSWVVLYKPKSSFSGEKMRVLVVAVPTKISNAYVTFFDNLGLEVVRIENEELSLVRSLISARKLPGVSLIVDIGFSTTKMVVSEGTQVYNNYVSQLAGMAFTRIIADNFKLPIPQAEQYKRTYGLEKNQLEGKIYHACEPVLAGLVNDIKKVISGYMNSYPNRPIDRLILAGGGSLIKGLVGIMAEQTGLEVVVGNAFESLKVVENLKPMGSTYAVAVGLATEE